MTGYVKIYRENYENLPKRFVNKIDSDIQYVLKANIPTLKKVYLFGSCARGEVRNSSDVDLLILTAQKLSDRTLADQIRWTLDEALCGVKTDVIYMNEESIQDRSTFKELVNRDRKLILEVME